MKKKNTNIRLVTAAILMSIYMTAVETTIVSTAMPTIIGNLQGMSIMNWVFAVYLLTNAMATPIYGKLSDKLGRKPMFLLGTLIFILGSSLCALSRNMPELILFRALQGVGAGALAPVAMTIMADIYPAEKRAKVLGFSNAVWGFASITGPLLGGFITDQLNWHWIFLINLPIGLIMMLIVWVYLVEPKRTGDKKEGLDIAGCLCLMGVLLTLLFGIQSIEAAKANVKAVVYFLIFLVLLILFIRIEKKVKDPIVSPKLFKSDGFIIMNIIIALSSGFLIGMNAYFPMWMQGVLGCSAAMGGMILIPVSITWALGSQFSGTMLPKMTARTILFIGLVIIGTGGIGIYFSPYQTPFMIFLLISAVAGAGLGIVFTTTMVSVQQIVPKDMVGVATSFYTLSQTIGQTVMVTVYGLVLNTHINNQITGNPVAGITKELMNRLINSAAAKDIPERLIYPLRQILYSGLHYVFTAALLLIGIAVFINLFNKTKMIFTK